MDELELLLLRAESSLRRKTIPSAQGYQPVIYTQSHATVHCQGCETTYKGLMTHVEGMDNLYDGYKTKYCPKCIGLHEKEWWSTCFRMEHVESV